MTDTDTRLMVPIVATLAMARIAQDVTILSLGEGNYSAQGGAIAGLMTIGTALLIYAIRIRWVAYQRGRLRLPSLLLVEDDDGAAEVIRRVLEPRYDVTVVGLVEEALTLLDRGARPVVAILDLMLPDGSGERVLDAIRARGLGCRVVVSSAGFGSRFDSARRKADVVLDKPYSFEDLHQAVNGKG